MTTPCATCADLLRDCGTCADYDLFLAAIEPPESKPCLTCVDIEVLVLSGELPEQVAARMGMHPDSVTRHLKGHQRADLLPKAVAW